MRFKAKLNCDQVQLLYNLITPISRLNSGNIPSNHESVVNHFSSIGGGGTVMYLDPDHVRISTRGSSAMSTHSSMEGRGCDADGIACFAELTTAIFLDHRIESAANNQILFEISLGQLRMALQSILISGKSNNSTAGNMQPLHNSSRTHNDEQVTTPAIVTIMSSPIIMKLAKRNGMACLCLDAMGGGRGGVEVHHAIPVLIMRAEEIQYHLPPQINLPDVQLELPNDRPLRTVVERLRSISNHIYIEGSMVGELTLRTEGDGASTRIFYNKLIPRFEDCKASIENEEIPSKCTLKVDSKKLFACLQWQQTLIIGRSVSSAVMCMVENEMLVLHIILHPGNLGFFTYYVPVHFLSSDQMDE